jgi:hypothetical protein
MLLHPKPLPQSPVPSFSHFNASERRQIAFRSRHLLIGVVVLFAAIIVIATVYNVGSALLNPRETPHSIRASRPTLAVLVSPHYFNAPSHTFDGNSTAQLQRHAPSAALVPPTIAAIITALGPAEIASLVQDMGENLSPHSAKLHASKITGAIVLE